MKTFKKIYLSTVLLLMFSDVFSQSWTGKLKLEFDSADKNVLYMCIVPDNTGDFDIYPTSTCFYLCFPAGTSYRAEPLLETQWQVKTLVTFRDSLPQSSADLVEVSLKSKYPTSGPGTAHSVTFEQDSVYRFVKFTLDSATCTAGAHFRIFEDVQAPLASGSLGTDPIKAWENAGVDQVMNVEGDDAAYTGNLTSWQNPLIYGDTLNSTADTMATDTTVSAGGPFFSGGELSVYPNPSSGVFEVEMSNDVDEPSEIVVLNMDGREVLRKNSVTRRIEKINMENCPVASYLLVYKFAKKRFQKIIVLKE